MFSRKTFNLVNEEEAKKREQLYKPKRCRWMKFIVIPAMIGFILLLILMNVDFSDKTKTELTTVATIGSTLSVTETTLKPKIVEQRTRSYNPLLNKAKVVTNAARCEHQAGDPCTLICADGNLSFLIDDLEDWKPSCNGDLNLILNNCFFPSQKLMPATLKVYFNYKTLEITNSDLLEIMDGAFEIPSMTRLQKLTLNTTGMSKLTDKSFVGLKALEELKFTNVPSLSKFEGVKFLQPLAEGLQHISICQKSSPVVNDPFSWFDGIKKFSSVTRVDLSGNNFANTLTEKTFSNLPAVRELILADCALTELNVNIFAEMMETLEYLDLSLNALQMLNVSTLISKKGLRLELHSNEWNCNCENYELIKALQASQFTYEEEPLCKTPSQLENMPLKEVILKCGEETSTTTQTPPSSITTSPVETTSSTSLETTASTINTTVTTTSPVETSDTSFETSSSLSTSSESEETAESENGKTTTTTTTASITTTTSSPPKPSPPPPPVNPIELKCKHFNDAATHPNYTISIRNFDVRFSVQPTSSSSVVLLISNSMEHFRMIFFTANNRTYVNVTEKSGVRGIPDCHCERSSSSLTKIHVRNLHSNETYIFCLIPVAEHTMSPFNCQSHYIDGETAASTAWLLTSDQAWFIIVIFFGIVLNICLGLIAVYRLLHWRPTWLRGCKRIIKAETISHEVYLLPKPLQKGTEQDDSKYESGSNSHRLRANMNLDFDSYDYMQFYKDLQDANRSRKIQTSSFILSPKEQAPAVPQNQTRTVSLQSTIPADDLIEQCEAVDDNDYQSIDYYEQLF